MLLVLLIPFLKSDLFQVPGMKLYKQIQTSRAEHRTWVRGRSLILVHIFYSSDFTFLGYYYSHTHIRNSVFQTQSQFFFGRQEIQSLKEYFITIESDENP